jgi:hypothetical protein
VRSIGSEANPIAALAEPAVAFVTATSVASETEPKTLASLARVPVGAAGKPGLDESHGAVLLYGDSVGARSGRARFESIQETSGLRLCRLWFDQEHGWCLLAVDGLARSGDLACLSGPRRGIFRPSGNIPPRPRRKVFQPGLGKPDDGSSLRRPTERAGVALTEASL